MDNRNVKAVIAAQVFALIFILTCSLSGDEPELLRGWYTWGGDHHNSRKATVSVRPPFRNIFKVQMPIGASDGDIGLLQQDNRIFAIVSHSGTYCRDGQSGNPVFAYTASTGEFLWREGKAAALGSLGHADILRGYVWGGGDHNYAYGVDIEKGETPAGVGMEQNYESFHVVDEYGAYSLGSEGNDNPRVYIKGMRVVNEPLIVPGEGVIRGGFSFNDFESAYDYLNFGDILDPGQNDLTIMFWFRPKRDHYAEQHLVKKGDLFWIAYTNDGKVRYNLKPDPLDTYGKPQLFGGDTLPCALNEWCHVTLTYDHNKERLYKNGELVFERDQTGDIGADDSIFALGSSVGPAHRNFRGDMDEVAIFSRALDAAEIASSYNEEIPDNTQGLELLLHLNNDPAYGESPTHIHDFSGNNHNWTYDGHINDYLLYRIFAGSAYEDYRHTPSPVEGVRSNHAMTGYWPSGQGQPAVNADILYVPNGILSALDKYTGEVIWQQGVYPLEESLGEVSYFSEVTYSNGKLYVAGRKNLKVHEGEAPHSNDWVRPEWDIVRLYELDAQTGTRLAEFDLPGTEITCSYPNMFQPANIDIRTIIDNDAAYVSWWNTIWKYDLITGDLLWQYYRRTVGKSDYPGSWSCQSYDIVLSDNVLYTVNQIDPLLENVTYSCYPSYLMALDTDTGEVIWEFKHPEQPFSTLIVADNRLFATTKDSCIYGFEPVDSAPLITGPDSKLPQGNANIPYYVMQSIYSKRNIFFSVKDGTWPYTWTVSDGRLPAGLNIVPDADQCHVYLDGTPQEVGDFSFKMQVTDADSISDEKEFTLRIIPDSLPFTAVLQNGVEGYTGCEDAIIDGHGTTGQNTNYGDGMVLLGGRGYGITETYKKRALMRFRIFDREGGPLPDDALVTDAQLTFYKEGSTYKHTISGYQVLKDWTQMLVTWNEAAPGNPWGIGGVNEVGVDRTEAMMTYKSDTTGFNTMDITSLFQGYDLGVQNYGWLFTQPAQSTIKIRSSEYTDTELEDDGISFRPKLSITYKRVPANNEPPVVKVYANPTTVIVPQFTTTDIIIDASGSHDPDGDSLEFRWSGGSYYAELTADSQNPAIATVTMSVPGHYYTYKKPYSSTISLQAVDPYGYYDERAIVVTASPPIDTTLITTSMLREGAVDTAYNDQVYVEGGSGYTFSIMSGALPPGLTLNASTGIISGTPTLAGTFTFTVHASGSTGGSDDQTLAIFITGDTPDNHPPTAEATAIPESGTAPLTVSFDGILSSDPDGVITDYTWDFGNNQTGTGETVSHTYTAAGTYTATLTVTDNGGLTDTDSVTISVTENVNEPPTAVDDSASTLEDTAVTIDVCANDSDPDGDEISVISVQCSENGNAAINNDSTITYISNPDFNGTDTFIYTISDGNNNTDTATVTVNITPVNDRPAAIASAAPISGDAPLAVSFTGTGSDPDNDTITYSWNFGDGHTSAAMSPSHTYESAGTYTAVLTVSDSILADEDSVLITVTEPGTEGQVTLKALDQHGENVTGAEILIYQDSGWVAYNSGSKVELDVGRRYLVKGRVMEHTGPYTWETIQEDTAEIIVPFQKFSFNAKDQNDNVISDAEITIYNISNIFSAGDTITLPTDTKMYIRTKRLGVSGPLNTVTATGSMNEYTALLQTVILGAEDQYSISVDDAEIFVYGVNTPFSPGDTVTLPLDSNPLIRGRRLDVYGSLEKINFSADRTAYNVPFRKVTFAARDQDGNDLTGAEIFISGMSGSFPSGTQLTLAQGASLYVNAKYNGEYCGSWQRLVIEQDLDEKVFMFELQ